MSLALFASLIWCIAVFSQLCFLLCQCELLHSIVMSTSVCVCVCLSARISPEPHARSLPNFCACCIWPSLCPALASLQYIVYLRFCGWHCRPIFTSTLLSRPNEVGFKCSSVLRRPSTKSFFHFNEIWSVGRGRWGMHDGKQFDPIQGYGHGHKPLKVGNPSIFNSYLHRQFTMGAGNWPLILKLGHNV